MVEGCGTNGKTSSWAVGGFEASTVLDMGAAGALAVPGMMYTCRQIGLALHYSWYQKYLPSYLLYYWSKNIFNDL